MNINIDKVSIKNTPEKYTIEINLEHSEIISKINHVFSENYIDIKLYFIPEDPMH